MVSPAKVMMLTVPGGVAIGVVCGLAAVTFAGRTTDHLIESALTTVAAYGSFLLAEHFHCSGVLATVAAGLVLGDLSILAEDEANRITRRGREFVLDLWEFIAFLINSVVFLLIGLTMGDLPFHHLGVIALLGIIALVLMVRRGFGLSDKPAFCLVPVGHHTDDAACPLVGRSPRRTRPGVGIVHSGRRSVPRSNPGCDVRSGRIFGGA